MTGASRDGGGRRESRGGRRGVEAPQRRHRQGAARAVRPCVTPKGAGQLRVTLGESDLLGIRTAVGGEREGERERERERDRRTLYKCTILYRLLCTLISTDLVQLSELCHSGLGRVQTRICRWLQVGWVIRELRYTSIQRVNPKYQDTGTSSLHPSMFTNHLRLCPGCACLCCREVVSQRGEEHDVLAASRSRSRLSSWRTGGLDNHGHCLLVERASALRSRTSSSIISTST